MPDWLNAEILKWLINNGVAVAVLFVFLFGVGRQVSDAVRYFTGKLDTIVTTSTSSNDKLTEAITGLSVQAAKNNEALRIVMLFISQNVEQIVAHRQAIEGAEAASVVPGPRITTSGEPTIHGGERPRSDSDPSNIASTTQN